MDKSFEKLRPAKRGIIKPELGGVRGQLFYMFQISDNISALDLIKTVMQEYTAQSLELHQRDDDESKVGLALLSSRESSLTNEDFPWNGVRNEGYSTQRMFGTTSDITEPFMAEWERNGGSNSVEEAFDTAFYLFAVRRSDIPS